MQSAKHVLKSVFGYDEFRPGQEDVVEAALAGRDVVAVLPTGGGKSLCYQIPALVQGGCSIVISPLIALMRDQTERLRSRGVTSAALHSGLSPGEMNDTLYQASLGKIQLLYVAPERLDVASFRSLVKNLPLKYLIVDEAHCISEWGHDYRPAYRLIPEIFTSIVRVPIIAVTATATTDVLQDIRTNLGMVDAVQVVKGFDRPNLDFHVAHTSAKIEQIQSILSNITDGASLIYAGSRKRVDQFTSMLQSSGVIAEGYHAGKPDVERSRIQDAFLGNTTDVLVATSAFGMGVDKPDIRSVMHVDLTLTLEAYYQEAGRAGRDGVQSTCVMIYDKQDVKLMEFFIRAAYPEPVEVQNVYSYITRRSGIGIGGECQDLLMIDAATISREVELPAAVVDGALGVLQKCGVILRVSGKGHASIRLTSTIQRARQFSSQAPAHKQDVYDVIIRNLETAARGANVDVPVERLRREYGFAEKEIYACLHELTMARLIQAVHSGGEGIYVMGAFVAANRLPIDADDLHRRRDHAMRKLDVVVGYATTKKCKRNYILEYFGETTSDTCGRCSSCTHSLPVAKLSEENTRIAVAAIQTVYQIGQKFGRNVVADILAGISSAKVTQYEMNRCRYWSSFANIERRAVMTGIDAAIDQGWLVASASSYPVLSITEAGTKKIEDRLRAIDLWNIPRPTRTAAADVMQALHELRNEIATKQSIMPRSVLSLKEMETIALDLPLSMRELTAGRHGSGAFITQYGARLVSLLQAFSPVAAGASKSLPENSVAISPSWDLVQAASIHKVTVAQMAALVQQEVESGSKIERGNLVPDSVYSDVLRYIRSHPYARLRHVREHVEAEVDITVLRCAMVFARRELFDGTSENQYL